METFFQIPAVAPVDTGQFPEEGIKHIGIHLFLLLFLLQFFFCDSALFSRSCL